LPTALSEKNTGSNFASGVFVRQLSCLAFLGFDNHHGLLRYRFIRVQGDHRIRPELRRCQGFFRGVLRSSEARTGSTETQLPAAETSTGETALIFAATSAAESRYTATESGNATAKTGSRAGTGRRNHL